MKNVKILVSIPEPLHRELMTMRSEGYTTSGYICSLIRNDLLARKEVGWSPVTGWKDAQQWRAKRSRENAAAYQERQRKEKRSKR